MRWHREEEELKIGFIVRVQKNSHSGKGNQRKFKSLNNHVLLKKVNFPEIKTKLLVILMVKKQQRGILQTENLHSYF